MQGLRREDGQSSVEYVGLLVVAAAVIAALVASGLPGQVATGVERAVCEILQADPCGEDPGSSSEPSTSVDPRLSAGQRRDLLGDPAGAQDVLATLSPEERRWLEQNDPEAARAAERATSWRERRKLTDRYVAGDLDDFLAYRESPDRDRRLNFTNDKCSAPLVGSTGISFDFTNACLRHDFGYRNYKELGLFEDNKAKVDRRFLKDMNDHCATRSFLLQARCYGWARRFYLGVVVFG